jgi:hypothetical protein
MVLLLLAVRNGELILRLRKTEEFVYQLIPNAQ